MKLAQKLMGWVSGSIGGTSTANGGNLQLHEDNWTNAQKFTFKYNSDRYYIITNVNSGKAIDYAGAGAVICSEYSRTSRFGNWIMIRHNNEKVSLYAHLSQRNVSYGNTVTKGQVIGRVGNTSAIYNIGYHLHFELGNSNTGGAAGDPYLDYYKNRYPLVVKCSTSK